MNCGGVFMLVILVLNYLIEINTLYTFLNKALQFPKKYHDKT